MTTLAKTYDPQAIERRWYDFWEQNGYFRPQGDGPPFCIMIPPPNVTGTLHMGHAFQDTIMDTLIRYHRMRGEQTLWQPGRRPRRYRNADGRRAPASRRGGDAA